MNGRLVNGEAPYFAHRVIQDAVATPEARIEKAFWLALGRSPSQQEKDKALDLLARGTPKEGLAQLGVVLVNLNEFLYLE
jgi:hypothetical protein